MSKVPDEIVVKAHLGQENIPTTSTGLELLHNLKRFRYLTEALVNVHDGSLISFESLLQNTCKLANSLQNWGLPKNGIVLVCSENNENFFTPVISCLYNGGIAAFLNPSYTVGELQYLSNIIRPQLIFCSKKVLHKMKELSCHLDSIQKIVIIDSIESIENVQSLNAFITEYCDRDFDIDHFRPVSVDAAEQVAFIFSSSGTTGLPKCVMLTHKNMSTRFVHTRDPVVRTLSEPNTVNLCPLPFFHGFGSISTLGFINAGLKTVFMQKFNEKQYIDAIVKYQVNMALAVPPIMVFLSKSSLLNKYNLSSLKEIVCGAAPLRQEVHEAVQKLLPQISIRQGYGLTEFTLAVTVMPTNVFKPGSSGVLVPFMDAKVVDTITGKSLGPNKIGELCFRGPLAMKGYFNNPEATNEILKEGWTHTGDIGYYDEDKYFYVVDRIKELIKYKGLQVAPAELEALILSYPKVQDVGVTGMHDIVSGEVPVAFVVKLPNTQINEEEILEFVAGKVAPYKRLHKVHFVSEIPKTASGKILRRQLKHILKTLKSKM